MATLFKKMVTSLVMLNALCLSASDQTINEKLAIYNSSDSQQDEKTARARKKFYIICAAGVCLCAALAYGEAAGLAPLENIVGAGQRVAKDAATTGTTMVKYFSTADLDDIIGKLLLVGVVLAPWIFLSSITPYSE